MRQEKIRTIRYGLETAVYHTLHLWSLAPADLKSLPNVDLFESKMNYFKCYKCPCKLSKIYLENIGYVQRFRQIN